VSVNLWARENNREAFNVVLDKIFVIVLKKSVKFDETISKLIKLPIGFVGCELCKKLFKNNINFIMNFLSRPTSVITISVVINIFSYIYHFFAYFFRTIQIELSQKKPIEAR